MNQPIIEVNNLTKVYRLGALGARSFAEETKAIFSKIIGKKFIPKDAIIDDQICSEGRLKNKNNFFALKDINFTVNKGEIVGIIGKNGAGKSTLLKILSRITEPTSGNAILRGRVGSLLEVGTGFHGDLTGRENTYLNGTILGMKRHEIDRKYEEIVTFAKLEKFMDTPVKRYSSGMFVRLAFSVAAHLESEILIIDEILAVGDQAFQDKCIGKMKDVSSKGRTVLFVSHNMQLVRKICPQTILLESGKVSDFGSTETIIQKYLSTPFTTNFDHRFAINDKTLRRGNGWIRFSSIQITDISHNQSQIFKVGEEIQFNLGWHANTAVKSIEVTVMFLSEIKREPLVAFPSEINRSYLQGDEGCLSIRVDTSNMLPGMFNLFFYIRDENNANCDIVDGIIPPLTLLGDGETHLSHSGFMKPTFIKLN